MKIGLLTTPNNPFIKFRIHALSNFLNISDLFIVYDKDFNEENFKNIWRDRYVLDDFKVGLDLRNIKSVFLKDHNNKNLIEFAKDNCIKYFINAGTPRKISKEIILNNYFKIINIHPGLFPSYRGANCIEWALLNNDLIGSTAHFMNDKYDDGTILKRILYRFNYIKNYKELRTLALKQDIELSSNIIKNIENYSKKKKIYFQRRISKFYGVMSVSKLNSVKEIIKNGIKQ